GRQRRHVDDHAAVAAESRRHATYRLLRSEESSSRVRGEHALKPLQADVHESGADADDARVVEEHIQAPELRVESLEQPRDVLRLADISLNGDRLATRRSYIGHDRIRRSLHCIEADGNIIAAPGSQA